MWYPQSDPLFIPLITTEGFFQGKSAPNKPNETPSAGVLKNLINWQLLMQTQWILINMTAGKEWLWIRTNPQFRSAASAKYELCATKSPKTCCAAKLPKGSMCFVLKLVWEILALEFSVITHSTTKSCGFQRRFRWTYNTVPKRRSSRPRKSIFTSVVAASVSTVSRFKLGQSISCKPFVGLTSFHRQKLWVSKEVQTNLQRSSKEEIL